jgi:TonB family protein
MFPEKNKLILIPAFTLLIIPFCYSQTRDDIVRAKVEKKLKENMHDPSSYEFVGLKLLATITYKDNIYSKRDGIKEGIESNISYLKLKLDHSDLLDSEEDFLAVKQLKMEIEKGYVLISKIDSLEKVLGNKVNTPIAYNYILRCRGKNGFGAKVLSEYFVQVKAPKLEVLNIASKAGEIMSGFGDFPGYGDIIAKEQSIKSMCSGKAQLFIDSLKEDLNPRTQLEVQDVSNSDFTAKQQGNQSNEANDRLIMVVEEQPEFEGGYEAIMDFIRKNKRNPASARRMGIDGTVYVSFVVRKNGTIDDVKVLRGISADCDKEAVRVVQMMPPWKPGGQNGKAVDVRLNLPIKFHLN